MLVVDGNDGAQLDEAGHVVAATQAAQPPPIQAASQTSSKEATEASYRRATNPHHNVITEPPGLALGQGAPRDD